MRKLQNLTPPYQAPLWWTKTSTFQTECSTRSRSRLITIWVDGGYGGTDFQHSVIDVYRWMLNVVTHHEEHKGFVVLPKRWLVERTFGCFNWCRRLSNTNSPKECDR